MAFNIFNVIQAWSQWIVDINDDDFPIGLSFVQQSHDAKDFDLLDLTRGSNEFSNLADV